MGWDDKEWDDYVRGQPGTFWGEIGRSQREQTQASSSISDLPGSNGVKSDAGVSEAKRVPFEETLVQWIFIAVWGAIAYVGIQYTKLEWYWPVGVGGMAGFALYRLFQGPLRGVLTGVKYLLIVAGVGLVGALIYHLAQKSG